VEQQIREEIDNGRYIITPVRPRIISALGAIVKDSGAVRLIHDCSRPHGNALNELAVGQKFSYQSVQDAVALVTPSCWFFKADLQAAYRSVKLASKEYPLTGLAWTFSGDQHPTFLFSFARAFSAAPSLARPVQRP